MSYLTAEEIFRLVISSDPSPSEFGETLASDLRILKRIGHFSEGAQDIVHRLQTDKAFLETMKSNPPDIFTGAYASSVNGYEVGPLMIAALLIESGISYAPERRSHFRVIPSREAVLRRFAGQTINLKEARKNIIHDLLKQVDTLSDPSVVVRRPRVLLALVDDLSLSEFVFAYVAFCTKLTLMSNPGAEEVTIPLAESVAGAIEKPTSVDARRKALDFLIGEDD